jgi:hypothetical protein
MSEALDRFTARGVFDEMYRKYPQDMFRALTGEAPPDDLPEIGTLTDVLNPDINNTGEEAEARENLALALQSYAGVLPAGTTEGDDLMPRVLQAARAVRALDISDRMAFQQAISADAEAAAQVMQQVSGLSVTPADGADVLIDLADKAAAAVGCGC